MLKKWLPLALKFVVSVALIWFLVSRIDLADTLARIQGIDLRMLLMAVAVLALQILICGLRWQAVLDAIKAPLNFVRTTLLFYIGIFFNQTLPSSVGGDAVRMYKARRAGLELSAAVNSVMLERAATVVALLVLVFATLPIFLTRVSDKAGTLLLVALALLGVAIIGSLVFLMLLDRLPERLRKWRIVRGLANLAIDARRVFLVPGPAIRAVGWGVMGHINIAISVYVLAVGMGLDITLADCLTLMPLVLLATTIPISIAGWGLREGAMVAAFGAVGVPATGAFALSVLFGLVGIAISLPGGLVWLMMRDGGTQDDARAAETAGL
jgi:uncharacterized membrane protein YbhN (UPF0104 family)